MVVHELLLGQCCAVFCYHCSLMHGAVCSINYIVESYFFRELMQLSGKNVGLNYLPWLLCCNGRQQ